MHSGCVDSHKDFPGLCGYSKLGGRAYIFHLHYGLTDMIMDPIPVFMKNCNMPRMSYSFGCITGSYELLVWAIQSTFVELDSLL